MMNKIKYFLRLRKQNDTVKLMIILVLAGMVSAGSVLYHVGMICRYVTTPVEYELTANQIVSAERIRALLQMKGVTAVSRQLNTPVTIRYQGAEAEIQAVVLSQEYVEEMYDRTLPSGAGRIFMNEAAFSNLQQEWIENRDGITEVESQKQGDGVAEWDVHYCITATMPDEIAGEDGTEMADRPARIIVTKNMAEREEPFVCLADTDQRLIREACSLRIQYRNHDLDGLHVSQLTKLGYVIENEDMILGEEYEIKIKLLHIQYGLVICVICLVGIWLCYSRAFYSP